jgi:hypothetical protein
VVQSLRIVRRRDIVLCAAYMGWSLAGTPLMLEMLAPYLDFGWGILIYIGVHLGLMVLILRTMGFRFWSVPFFIVGLIISPLPYVFLLSFIILYLRGGSFV